MNSVNIVASSSILDYARHRRHATKVLFRGYLTPEGKLIGIFNREMTREVVDGEVCYYEAIGKVKKKVLPWSRPGLSAQMRPLWASTRCLAMVNPIPLPPLARVRDLSTR